MLSRVWDSMLNASDIIVVVRAREVDSMVFLGLMSKVLGEKRKDVTVILSLRPDDSYEATVSDFMKWYPGMSWGAFYPVDDLGATFEAASSNDVLETLGMDSISHSLAKRSRTCFVSLVDHVFLIKCLEFWIQQTVMPIDPPTDVYLYGGVHFAHLGPELRLELASLLNELTKLPASIHVFEAFHALSGTNSCNSLNMPRLMQAIDETMPHIQSQSDARSLEIARECITSAIDTMRTFFDFSALQNTEDSLSVTVWPRNAVLDIVTWVASFFTSKIPPPPFYQVNKVCVQTASKEELHEISATLIRAINASPKSHPQINDVSNSSSALFDATLGFNCTLDGIQFPVADMIVAGAPNSLMQPRWCEFDPTTGRLRMSPSGSSTSSTGFEAGCAILSPPATPDSALNEIEGNVLWILGV